MERFYSTADVCELLDISKSTLLRWEKEDWFPVVPRDTKNERQYTLQHIRVISQHQDGEKSRKAALAEDTVRMAEIDELSNYFKFLCERDVSRLRHLQYLDLHDKTIKHLLRLALDEYEPSDETFREIIDTIQTQAGRRAHGITLEPVS